MRFFLTGGLLIALATPAAAQTGTITGTVRDEGGIPIAGAEVRVIGTAYRTRSGSNGRFKIEHLPAGAADLVALMVGYRPSIARGIVISLDESVHLPFTLEVSGGGIETTLAPAVPRLLVPRDLNTSRFHITREMLGHDPIQP